MSKYEGFKADSSRETSALLSPRVLQASQVSHAEQKNRSKLAVGQSNRQALDATIEIAELLRTGNSLATEQALLKLTGLQHLLATERSD